MLRATLQRAARCADTQAAAQLQTALSNDTTLAKVLGLLAAKVPCRAYARLPYAAAPPAPALPQRTLRPATPAGSSTSGAGGSASSSSTVSVEAQSSQPAGAAALPAAAAPAASSTAEAQAMELQRQGAQTATAWMFPWERRQLAGEKTPLRPWERAYWGLFVAGLGFLLFTRAYNSSAPPPLPVDTDKEEARQRAARMVLAGASFTQEERDVFEGLSPQEIEKYVKEATSGATAEDPFEGMSPEEINEFLEQKKDKA